MKLIIILLSLAAFVSAGTLPNVGDINPVFGYMRKYGIPEAERIQKAEEAYLNSLSSRIIGGSPARPAQFPYQAGLIADLLGTEGRGVCGGSLLSISKLLTAAHCWFDGENQAWRFTVVLGSNLLFTGGTRLLTSSVINHPLWFPWLIRNDISVVTITPVTLSATISPIGLPTGPELQESFAGSIATVSGFGLTDRAGNISPDQYLSFLTTNILSHDVCVTVVPVAQPSNICTSALGGSSPWRGDSGGPLVVERGGRRIVVGVVSFGVNLPLPFPSVYARVTSFISFIQQNL